jgi:hypothetical protein
MEDEKSISAGLVIRVCHRLQMMHEDAVGPGGETRSKDMT